MDGETNLLQGPRCGTVNPKGYKFCGQCGAALREAFLPSETDSADKNTPGAFPEALGAERQEAAHVLSTAQAGRAGATDADRELGSGWDLFIAGLAAVVFFPFGWLLPAFILFAIADANPGLTLIAFLGGMLACINPAIGVGVSALVFRYVRNLLHRRVVSCGGVLLGILTFIATTWGSLRLGWLNASLSTMTLHFVIGVIPAAIVAREVTALHRKGVLNDRKVVVGTMIVLASLVLLLLLDLMGVIPGQEGILIPEDLTPWEPTPAMVPEGWHY